MQKNLYKLSKKQENIFKKIAQEFGTPSYVYFQFEIEKQISIMKKYKAPFGLTIRYAMKANPNLSILKLMDKKGVHIDASTFQEVYRAMDAEISPKNILLTSQQLPPEEILIDLVNKGVNYNATSLNQLELYGINFPNSNISIRLNLGIGSSWIAKMNTGGLDSSFGIYNKFDEIDVLLEKYNLNLKRIHLHIGSGSDPKKQTKALKKVLEIVEKYPSVKILNMGGGFKIARVEGEKETDVIRLSRKGENLLKDFYKKTKRKIKLEVEPGTFLVANAGFVVSEVRDETDTGLRGKNFLKLNTGMNDNTRIPLYGAQHPIYHIKIKGGNKSKKDYVLVGECCESSDIITCKSGDADKQRKEVFVGVQLGDLVVLGGSGAYCAGMSLGNYNSKPRSAEILVLNNGKIKIIRRAEKLKDIWKSDVLVDFK